MNDILQKIFTEAGFEASLAGGQRYYFKGERAYFFLLDINITEMGNLKSFTDLESNGRYIELKNSFNTLVKEGTSNTLQKNSALLITVKCTSLAALHDQQQQILMLEEDEYFFKKYVLLYTDACIAGLNVAGLVIPVLQDKVRDEANFNRYAGEGYSAALDEYMVVLQLFIKLPFLKLSFDGAEYKPLDQKIIDSLGPELNQNYEDFLTIAPQLSGVDFTDHNSEQLIDQLTTLMFND